MQQFSFAVRLRCQAHRTPCLGRNPGLINLAWNNSPIVSFDSMGQTPAPGSEFACGASLSAHGLFILLYARRSNELNAPKGKPRMRTLIRNPALFLARPRPGAPGSRLLARILHQGLR